MSQTAVKRLNKEFSRMQSSDLIARPNPQNILEWHFIIPESPDSPYSQGEYHGSLVFPSNYPFSPPKIVMFTPSGRFQTNRRLCLSMSDFHPKSWNPSWSVETIIRGIHSFMNSEEPATGSFTVGNAERIQLARNSWAFNRKQQVFREIFPERLDYTVPEEEKKVEDKSILPGIVVLVLSLLLFRFGPSIFFG